MDSSAAKEINLSQELSIYNVSLFKQEVLERLAEKSDLIFDCSQLELIDAAGMQLILSLQKTLLNEEFNLKLRNISSEVEEVFELVGVEEILDYELRGD